MKNLIIKMLTVVVSFNIHIFYAQDSADLKLEELSEVVVTATKFQIKKENIGKNIVIISKETIERMPFQTVAKLLNEISGIEINGIMGAAGKNLSYYVRGGRSHQLLILVDGIPVTDPSGIGFSYDLNLLSLNQVESIEIMKGAASTLYGSGAATGVINITLKKATKESFKGSAMLSVGTNNATNQKKYDLNNYTQSIDISGSHKKSSYLFSFSNLYSEGLSEANSENNDIKETDPFHQINILGKLEQHFSNEFSINSIVSLRQIKHDYDFAFSDSDKNSYKNKEFLIGLNPVLKLDKVTVKGNITYKSLDRNDKNEYGDSEYQSESITADIFNKINLSNRWTLVSGADYQFHNTNMDTDYEVLKKDKAHFYMIDPYFTAIYQSNDGFNLNIGSRLNIHEKYGKHLVYNINPSYLLTSSKYKINFLGSFSTAFITPSLYQLYSSYGNLNLNPEASSTYELGYNFRLKNKKLTFNQVFFFREEKEKIGFYTDYTTWESFYYNQNDQQFFRGIENELTYSVTDKLLLNFNYTYTYLDDKNSFLIPKNKFNSTLNYTLNTNHQFSIQYQYNGKRTAQDFREFPAKIENLKAYQLVNLSYNTTLIKNRFHLFLDINNLFDEDFIENLGYVTKGTNLNLGVKLDF